MSLPPGFLDELKTRVSITQVVGRRVTWDSRKSQQSRGKMWACCPFHQEKTPSFHVDEGQGRYYCFGCHEKGDALNFVQATENVDFMEAVKILAAEAGMTVPAPSPEARRQADRMEVLREAMAGAERFFARQMKGAGGRAARDYLDGRGLGSEAQARWGLGFAPDGWRTLFEAARSGGTDAEVLIAAGLAKARDGVEPYDVFRNRVMFPIRDPRGRTIAFGGRAMVADDRSPKYLNSPQTPLFDKSRTLFNHGPARAATRHGPLIVAEGYMDVIALSEAGFAASVAPLGTAVTEHQLRALWAMAEEPVMALDGDRAGRQAALRAVDLALPLLEAGRSLRICLMPPGQDPDDVIRGGGAAAMQGLLDGAVSMMDLIWQDAVEGRHFDSPERRAALERGLKTRIAPIADPVLRQHFDREIRDRMWRLGRAAPAGRSRRATPEGVRSATRATALAADPGAGPRRQWEATVLAVLLRYPALLPEREDLLGRIECADPGHAALLAALLTVPDGMDPSAHVEARCGAAALERLAVLRHLGLSSAFDTDDVDLAARFLDGDLARLVCEAGVAHEIAEARQDIAGASDEALTWRLTEATRAALDARRGDADDPTVFETAPNGNRLSRSERDAFDALMAQIGVNRGPPG